MKIGYHGGGARPGTVAFDLVPAESTRSMTWERSAPRTVASSTPSRLVNEDAPPGAHPRPRGGDAMERLIERGCGVDVHRDTVVACVRVPGAQHVQTFGTTAVELLALRDWLEAHRVTHVAME